MYCDKVDDDGSGQQMQEARMRGIASGHECLHAAYFINPDDVTSCAARDVPGVCTMDCALYRSRSVAALAATKTGI
jgi:hypothetical protein